MTCERMEELFSAFLEDELDSAEKRRFEDHLRFCPECADLLGRLRVLTESLNTFPEVAVPPRLVERLRAIPARRRPFKIFQSVADFLLKPSLQPVYAAAAGVLILISTIVFHPDSPGIRRDIDLQIHKSYAQAERLYARAGALAGELGAITETAIDSVKNLPVLQKDTENP